MAREETRTRTVGCKVTVSEQEQLERSAAQAGQTLSEWCRQRLLEAASAQVGTVAEQAVLAEVLALRTILLNLFFQLGKGQTVASEQMRQLIERADAEKRASALARLAAARNGREPEAQG